MSFQKSHGLRFHIILLWRQWEMCKLWEVVSYEKIGLKSLYCIVALKVLLVKIILAQSFILYRPHMMWQLGHILIYAEFIKTKILCFRFFFHSREYLYFSHDVLFSLVPRWAVLSNTFYVLLMMNILSLPTLSLICLWTIFF